MENVIKIWRKGLRIFLVARQETTVPHLSENIRQCTKNAFEFPVHFGATAHHIQLLDAMQSGYFHNIKLFPNVFF